jgi:hypothetical protein
MTTPMNNPVFFQVRTHRSRCQHTQRNHRRECAAFAMVIAGISCGPTRSRDFAANGVGNGIEVFDQ